MTFQKLLTADEARLLTGIDEELRKIDLDIRDEVNLGLRQYNIKDAVAIKAESAEKLDRICLSLRGRGFQVELSENPMRVKISW